MHGGKGWALLHSRWGEFNVEQQALMVEDWFEAGLPHNDDRFKFIRDNILKGNNS